MSRRRSYVSAFAQMQREAARAQAAQVRAQAAARKEAERARTAYLRALVADEKERKRLYAESRAAEVAAKNDDLEAEIAALQHRLLPETCISHVKRWLPVMELSCEANTTDGDTLTDCGMNSVLIVGGGSRAVDQAVL